jgi:hypothetical protein
VFCSVAQLQGDMATITFLILMVFRLFPFADYRWLTNEMNANLPLELDFKVEVGGYWALLMLILPFGLVIHARFNEGNPCTCFPGGQS